MILRKRAFIAVIAALALLAMPEIPLIEQLGESPATVVYGDSASGSSNNPAAPAVHNVTVDANKIVVDFKNKENTFSSGTIKWNSIKLDDIARAMTPIVSYTDFDSIAFNGNSILINFASKNSSIRIRNYADRVEFEELKDRANSFYAYDGRYYALESWYLDSFKDGKARDKYSLYYSADANNWEKIEFKLPFSRTLPKTIIAKGGFIISSDNMLGSIDGKVEGYYLHTRNFFKKDNKYYMALNLVFYGTDKEGKRKLCDDGTDQDGKPVTADRFIIESSDLKEWHMYKPHATIWESMNKRSDSILPDNISANADSIKKCFFSNYGKIISEKNVDIELYDSKVVSEGNCKYIAVNVALSGKKRTLDDKITTIGCVFKVDKKNTTMIYPSKIEDIKSRVNKSISKDQLRLYRFSKEGSKFVAIYNDAASSEFNVKEVNNIIAFSTFYNNYYFLRQNNRYFFFRGYNVYVGEDMTSNK